MNRRSARLVILAVSLAAGAASFCWYAFATRPYRGGPINPDDAQDLLDYRQITASRWERWKWGHVKISAGGIVVDETGAPVPGAWVSYSIQEPADWNPPPSEELRSDAAGRFTIPEGNGYRASIGAVHPSYHTLLESAAYVYPRGSLYEELDRYRFYPDQEVRLVLRKKLPLEPLMNRLQERHPIPAEDKLTLAVDKAGDKRLQLEFSASPPAPGTLPFDWELRIVPKDGKIQRKPHGLQVLAPEDGYLPEIKIARKVQDITWFAGDHAEFFIRFDDGTFAWGRIFCDARDRRVTFNCNYNPAQSRNLEPGLYVE